LLCEGTLIYPEPQLAAVHGLTDICFVANRFAALRKLPAEPALRVSHWRQIANAKAVECVFDAIPGHTSARYNAYPASSPKRRIRRTNPPHSLGLLIARPIQFALGTSTQSWHTARGIVRSK
jgi:hypothetical protein